jgi:hypothetical protein
MDKATTYAAKSLIDEMASTVRRERERNAHPPKSEIEEKLRLRYMSALRSMNRLTEEEAGKLLQANMPQKPSLLTAG